MEAGGFGERADGVEDGECRGGFLQVVDLAEDGAAEFGEDFDLAGAGALVRAEDFAFKFFETFFLNPGNADALRSTLPPV